MKPFQLCCTIVCISFGCQGASYYVANGAFVDFNSRSNASANNPPFEVLCNGSGACSGTTAVYGTTGLNETYQAYGSATYGVLRTFASAAIAGSVQTGSVASDEYSVVRGDSEYADTLTVSGGSPGTSGTQTLTFTLSGSSSATASNTAIPLMYIVENNQIYGSGAPGTQCSGPSGNTITCSGIPIVFGQPTTYEVDLWSLVNIYDLTAGSSAIADYSHTAVLTSIAVQDANGNPVSRFSIQSASGTVYTNDGVVPEPAVLPLCAGGLLLIAAMTPRRRRRRQTI